MLVLCVYWVIQIMCSSSVEPNGAISTNIGCPKIKCPKIGHPKIKFTSEALLEP